jgi:hypothetical protein
MSNAQVDDGYQSRNREHEFVRAEFSGCEGVDKSEADNQEQKPVSQHMPGLQSALRG